MSSIPKVSGGRIEQQRGSEKEKVHVVAVTKRQQREHEPDSDADTSHRPEVIAGSDRHDVNGNLRFEATLPPHSASDMDRFLRKKEYITHPFSYPSISLFIGGLGTGKSTAIYGVTNELMSILKPSEVGDFILYTGSPADKIIDAYSDKVAKYSPESNESFLTHIRNILHAQTTLPHDKKKRHIIVLDDAVGQPWFPKTTKSDSPVAQLFMSTRHIPASIYISSQKATDLSTFARNNSSHIFFWKSKSKTERQAILNEIGGGGGGVEKTAENALDSLKDNEYLWADKRRGIIHKGLNQTIVH